MDGNKFFEAVHVRKSDRLFRENFIQPETNRLQMKLIRNGVKGINLSSKIVINEVWHELIGQTDHQVIKSMLNNPAYEMKESEKAPQQCFPTCVQEKR